MAILEKIISAAFKFFGKKGGRSPKGEKKRRIKKTPGQKVRKPKAPRKSPPAAKKKASKPAKKTSKKPAPPKKGALQQERIGVITHYFSKIQVVVIKLTRELKVGERIHIKGRSSDFVQSVKSLQIESVDVKVAKKGQLVGLRVNKIAKEGDLVLCPK